MREVQLPAEHERFAACGACGATPRHVVSHGRTRDETMHAGIPTIRHRLECPCGRATGRHGSLTGAEADWGERYAQRVLALPPPLPETTRAALRRPSSPIY